MDVRERLRVYAFRGVCIGMLSGASVACTVGAFLEADRAVLAKSAIALAIGCALLLVAVAEDD